LRDEDGRIANFLKTQKENLPTLPAKGSIACYSHNQVGSSYAVGGNTYVMGIVPGLNGRYFGRIFQPAGFENKDISSEQLFKDHCNARFPACKDGCWAGGDTGVFSESK
jgi:hypothetical protein